MNNSSGCFKLRDLGDLIDLARLVGTAAKKGSVAWHKNVAQADFVLGRYFMNLHGQEWNHSNVQKAVEVLVADGRVFQQQNMNDANIRLDVNLLAISNAGRLEAAKELGPECNIADADKENDSKVDSQIEAAKELGPESKIADDSKVDNPVNKTASSITTATEATGSSGTCQGTKGSGGPCGGKAMKNSSFCRHHQNQAV